MDDTLFIRNLSFDTQQDSLKKFIEDNFGETEYCLICKDKATQESKGTAFVKFKDKSNVAKCLEEFKDFENQTKFHLDGRNLMVLPAMSRDKIQEMKQATSDRLEAAEKKKKRKKKIRKKMSKKASANKTADAPPSKSKPGKVKPSKSKPGNVKLSKAKPGNVKPSKAKPAKGKQRKVKPSSKGKGLKLR